MTEHATPVDYQPEITARKGGIAEAEAALARFAIFRSENGFTDAALATMEAGLTEAERQWVEERIAAMDVEMNADIAAADGGGYRRARLSHVNV